MHSSGDVQNVGIVTENYEFEEQEYEHCFTKIVGGRKVWKKGCLW